MGTNNAGRGVSRRKVFGLGAATAGVVATGAAKSAFAGVGANERDVPMSDGGDIGPVGAFTSAIVRVPGTQIAVFAATDFTADEEPVNVALDGKVSTAVPVDFIETNLRIPPGSVIRRIDALGFRNTAGSQSWYVQRYDPTNFGVGSQYGLYSASASGTGNLAVTLAIPAAGLPTLESMVYAVYLTNVSPDSLAYGVAVQYDPPTRAFHPIDPVRVYDSRAAAPTPGVMARNTNRVISVKDGRDSAGTVTAADVVPPGATAVTFNVTATGTTGPNFLAVAPGDATGFSTSTLNWAGGYDIANASTVKLDASRQVKIFMGDQSGSSHVIVDITGYYL